MSNKESNFFPKGVTALIIYRAIPEISSFTGLSDYLTVLGKDLSRRKKIDTGYSPITIPNDGEELSEVSYGRRIIYRQRRNKVLKYALEKLRKTHLIENGEAPGTYIALANYENYLNFLKHNASSLYERMKFYIAWSISEMVQSIVEVYIGLTEPIEVSNKAKFTHSIDLQVQFIISLNKQGLIYKVVYPFISGKFEPYLEDKEQLDLLKLLLDSMDFTPKDTHLAVQDIVFNSRKQSSWIDEEIDKFLDLERDGYVKYLDIVKAEFDAIMKTVDREEYIRKYKKAIENPHPRNTIWSDTTKPWWLIQFQKNLKKLVSDLKIGGHDK